MVCQSLHEKAMIDNAPPHIAIMIPDAPVNKDGFNLIGKVIWIGHEVK